jgi:hypothetical protein
MAMVNFSLGCNDRCFRRGPESLGRIRPIFDTPGIAPLSTADQANEQIGALVPIWNAVARKAD